MNDEQQERRRVMNLTQEQIEQIAEVASEMAVKKMQASLYQEIGRTFVSKALQVIGIALVGFAVWLNSKGLLRVGD